MTKLKNQFQPKDNSKLQRFFFFMGPMLASFHVATYIVSFFGVGAVAKWISEQWFPFTRWLWTELFIWAEQYISLPLFNDVEKDALTTALFFSPLGIYAMFFKKDHPLDDKYKIAAIFIGLFFVIVVGIRLLSVVFGAIFSIDFLPLTGWGWLYLILSVTYILFHLIMKGVTSKSSIPLTSSDVFNTISIAAILYALVLITERVLNLGIVTSFCFIIVFVLSGSAIYHTPYRLSWGLGSLFAFILSGFLFDGVLLLAEFIEMRK
ncbi:hypothetical protein [uncultured Cocleimonas sp.]|uniref:hypothetical protein n=1 Tax=uncultured Cocleimonas sp. TaxID=1051587 RepID=UPI0026027005|nr:hypothetical protein [uncultured Cocleimonas sp.]